MTDIAEIKPALFQTVSAARNQVAAAKTIYPGYHLKVEYLAANATLRRLAPEWCDNFIVSIFNANGNFVSCLTEADVVRV